ncbi:T9SS type A sorting domain-containing protein [candidate division KSB1 bacterium]
MVKRVIFFAFAIFIITENIFAIEVSIPDISAKGGTSVSVPIMVTDLTGKEVFGFDFCVGFDKNLLKATGASTSGTLSSGFMIAQNPNIEGQIIVAAASSRPIVGEGVLIYLNFNVNPINNPWVSELTSLVFKKTDRNNRGFRFNSGVPATLMKSGSVTVENIISLNSLPDFEIFENSIDSSLVLNDFLEGDDIDTSQISWIYLNNANIDTIYKDNSAVVFSPVKDWIGEKATIFSCEYMGFAKYDTINLTVLRKSDINERTTYTLSSDTKILPYIFSDSSKLKINFKSGNYGGHELSVTAFGDEIPDTILNVPSFKSVVNYFSIESDINTFSVDLSFGYTDDMLKNSNINEDNLIIAYYDTLYSEWKSLPTVIDTDKNIVITEIDHFSLWVLTDKNDDLIVGIEKEEIYSGLPLYYMLHQNYPNPFNPETNIRFDLPKSADVTLRIYNILGQEVRTLVNERMHAGSYSVIWDSKNNAGLFVSSGVYIYVLKAGDFIMTRKMTLMR